MTPYRSPPSPSEPQSSPDDFRAALVFLAIFLTVVVSVLGRGIPGDPSDDHAGGATLWHHGEGSAGRGGAGGHR